MSFLFKIIIIILISTKIEGKIINHFKGIKAKANCKSQGLISKIISHFKGIKADRKISKESIIKKSLPITGRMVVSSAFRYFRDFLGLEELKILESNGSIEKASRNRHKELLAAVDEAIYISDISKYTDELQVFVDKRKDIADNAYAINLLTVSSIGIGENILLKKLPKSLLVSLILHEFSHIRDNKKNIFVDIIQFALSSVSTSLSFAFFLSCLLKPATLAYRRNNEFEADLYAATFVGSDDVILLLQALGGIPLWLVKLQHSYGFIIPVSKLSKFHTNFNDPKNDVNKIEVLLSTHPSLKKRIERLQRYEKERRNLSINSNK